MVNILPEGHDIDAPWLRPALGGHLQPGHTAAAIDLSFDPHHHRGGLDHRIGPLARLRRRLMDGIPGDGGAHGGAVHTDGNDALHRTLIRLAHHAGELISCAQLHDLTSCFPAASE